MTSSTTTKSGILVAFLGAILITLTFALPTNKADEGDKLELTVPWWRVALFIAGFAATFGGVLVARA